MSAVCNTEVVVVRAPPAPAVLECGGSPMVASGSARTAGAAPAPEHGGGTLLGKRYADEALGLEVLCIKAGQGSLSIDGKALALRATKPLPSSD